MLFILKREKEEKRSLAFFLVKSSSISASLTDLSLVFKTSLLIKNKLSTKNKQFGFLKISFKDTQSLLFENFFFTMTLKLLDLIFY